ncbi:hypothetical protein [Kitasatospora griseola]|nr:hypothetical protein [Kitasatospora griseola]
MLDVTEAGLVLFAMASGVSVGQVVAATAAPPHVPASAARPT